MIRLLSYLIAFISIVSAVLGIWAFWLEFGDRIAPPWTPVTPVTVQPDEPERKPAPPTDCSAIQDRSERIFCINKQKQEEECAKTNCRAPTKGQALLALPPPDMTVEQRASN
jgi:hypothetical protein